LYNNTFTPAPPVIVKFKYPQIRVHCN